MDLSVIHRFVPYAVSKMIVGNTSKTCAWKILRSALALNAVSLA